MDHPEKQDTGRAQTKQKKQKHRQNMNFCLALKEFEDTKGAIRIRISTENR